MEASKRKKGNFIFHLDSNFESTETVWINLFLFNK